MKLLATLGEISDKGDWEAFCDRTGYNQYCLNEGADPDIVVVLSLEDAVTYGLILRES